MQLPPFALMFLPPYIGAGASFLALVGLLMIIFKPFSPGLAVSGLTMVAAAGYATYLQGGVGVGAVICGVMMLFFFAVGQFSGWWTHKLGVHYVYSTPQLIWGGFLGMCLMMIFRAPLFLQIIALFVGAMGASMGIEKRPFKESLSRGPLGVYSSLGPRGLHLLMALVVIDLSTYYVLMLSRG